MRTWPSWLLLAHFGVLVAPPAKAAPEDRGPYSVAIFEAGSLPIAGVQIPTKVYYPSDAGGPGPLVVMMHGNLRNGSYHAELSNTLASQGFVVVLPDMPCGLGGCNHDENATQLSELLTWASAQNAEAASPIFGKSNGRRGLLGHSYGGLGVFLATARDESVEAVVLFDPKDDLGAAQTEQANVRVPSAHLMADVRGLCNDDWGAAVYPNVTGPRLRVRVTGSGHCDVEDPSDSLCPFACSAGNGGTHLFRRYAVAFMGCVLKGDVAMEPYIGGASMGQDQAAGLIDSVDHAGIENLPCRSSTTAPPLVDAGPSGGTDAGGPRPDAGSRVEAGMDDEDSGEPNGSYRPPRDAGAGSEDSDGCRCISLAATHRWDLFALLLPLIVFTSRARGRRGRDRRVRAERSRSE